MKILAIESSCDETAAAIVENGTTVVSSAVASSTEFHKKYGGIVPEVAAREQVKSIIPVLMETINTTIQQNDKLTIQQYIESEIDAIAVTVGPGLIGSLLVGVETAKTLAFVTKKPIIPVNHVLAHMYANFIVSPQLSVESQQKSQELKADSRKLIAFPAISLVVSGGHTELFFMKDEKTIQWLGGTVDDAAGEAFDKTARLLGFDNGGGPAIQRAASQVKVKSEKVKVTLPRPLMYDKSLNFSFSGLKTAIVREWKKYDEHPQELVYAFAHEVQEAITDVLVAKTIHAAEMYGAKSILVSGGVAANTRLREKLKVKSEKFKVHVPPVELCTDNAVYIGSYAFFRGTPVDWHTITATPDLTVEV